MQHGATRRSPAACDKSCRKCRDDLTIETAGSRLITHCRPQSPRDSSPIVSGRLAPRLTVIGIGDEWKCLLERVQFHHASHPEVNSFCISREAGSQREPCYAGRKEITDAIAGAQLVLIVLRFDEASLNLGRLVADVASEANALAIALTMESRSQNEGFAKSPSFDAFEKAIVSLIEVADDSRIAESGSHGAWAGTLGSFERAVHAIVTYLRDDDELVGVDIEDMRTLFSEGKYTYLRTGCGSGPDRAIRAVDDALGDSRGRKNSQAATVGLLVNIAATRSLRMLEVRDAINEVRSLAGPKTRMLLKVHYDEGLGSVFRLSVMSLFGGVMK